MFMKNDYDFTLYICGIYEESKIYKYTAYDDDDETSAQLTIYDVRVLYTEWFAPVGCKSLPHLRRSHNPNKRCTRVCKSPTRAASHSVNI